MAVENKFPVCDLHATLVHRLDLALRWTYRYAGRDHRLTDTLGRVAQKLSAPNYLGYLEWAS